MLKLFFLVKIWDTIAFLSQNLGYHCIEDIWLKNHDYQERVVNIKRRVFQVVHSLHISSFMKKTTQLAIHKQVILIGVASGGLIILRGVLIIHSCFCVTLRTMFNSSLGGGGGGG